MNYIIVIIILPIGEKSRKPPLIGFSLFVLNFQFFQGLRNNRISFKFHLPFRCMKYIILITIVQLVARWFLNCTNQIPEFGHKLVGSVIAIVDKSKKHFHFFQGLWNNRTSFKIHLHSLCVKFPVFLIIVHLFSKWFLKCANQTY